MNVPQGFADFTLQVPVTWRTNTAGHKSLLTGCLHNAQVVINAQSHIGDWVGEFIGRCQEWTQLALSA